MKDLSEYLKKFKVVLFKNEEQVLLIQDIIKKILHIELSAKEIEIKGDTIFIKGSVLIKNELFLNKNKILKELSETNLHYIRELR